jgi:hypothetical protein
VINECAIRGVLFVAVLFHQEVPAEGAPSRSDAERLTGSICEIQCGMEHHQTTCSERQICVKYCYDCNGRQGACAIAYCKEPDISFLEPDTSVCTY